MNTRSKPFDFDEWKQLSESDPAEFEARRRRVIEAEIGLAAKSQQQRLRGLQWQIDLIRKRYRDPLVSTAKLFDMMWQKVYGANGLLEALTTADRESSATYPKLEVKLLHFPKQQTHSLVKKPVKNSAS